MIYCFTVMWLMIISLMHMSLYNHLIIVGILGGLVGNLTSIGGGIIFIPALISIGITPIDALGVAIANQAFGMMMGSIAWARMNGSPDWPQIMRVAPSLLLGSSIPNIVVRISNSIIQLLYSLVSISLGISFLRRIPINNIPLHLIQVIGGFISGCIAIGDGEFTTSYYLARGKSYSYAVQTGIMLQFMNSSYLLLLHSTILSPVNWSIAVYTSLGCMWGAHLAPTAYTYLGAPRARLIFSLVCILDGILVLLEYLTNTIQWNQIIR